MTKSRLQSLFLILCTALCVTACKKDTPESPLRKIKSMTTSGDVQTERIEFSYDGENLSEVKRIVSGRLQHIFRYSYNGAYPKQVLHYFYDQNTAQERLRATINFTYTGDQLASFEALPTDEYRGALKSTYTLTSTGASVPEMTVLIPGSAPRRIPNVVYADAIDRDVWTASGTPSPKPAFTLADLMAKTVYDNKRNPLYGLPLLWSMYLEKPLVTAPFITNYLATPFYVFDLEAFFLENNKTHFAHYLDAQGNQVYVVDVTYTYDAQGYPTKSIQKAVGSNNNGVQTIYEYW
jgi:hypothetical protein